MEFGWFHGQLTFYLGLVYRPYSSKIGISSVFRPKMLKRQMINNEARRNWPARTWTMTRLGNGDWLLDFALELSEKALVFVSNMVISANGPVDALAVVIALASSSLAICSEKAPIFASLILFFALFRALSRTNKLDSRAEFAVCSFHHAKRRIRYAVRSANRVVFCRTERERWHAWNVSFKTTRWCFVLLQTSPHHTILAHCNSTIAISL